MPPTEPSRLTLRAVIRNLLAATVLVVISIVMAVSLGTLVFAGPLAPFVSVGIGLFLVSTAVNGFLVPAFSDYKAMRAGPRSGHAPIFAAMAAGIAATMPDAPVEAAAITVVASILVATLVAGLVAFAVGQAKLGTLARYIPFPVMAGFFAGLGYLLLEGGMIVAADLSFTAASLTSLSAERALQLLAALAFGFGLFALERRIHHWLLIPLFLAAWVVIFHGILLVTGTSIADATAAGWFTVFDASVERFFPVFTLDQLALVDWMVVAGQYQTFLVLSLLTIIMLLLDIAGIEIVIKRDLDPNRELKSAGLANILGAFLASPLGFGDSAETAFGRKLGGDTLLFAAFFSALVIIVIFAGPAPIALIPIPVVAGFLIYIGVNFLVAFVWQLRRQMPATDLAVILIMLATIAFLGVLEGVAVGIVLACGLFVLTYSRLKVVKTTLSGNDYVSSIDRHRDDQAYLNRHGDEVRIVSLQGYLFFGSASQFLDEIKTIIKAQRDKPPRYLIVDLARVYGMDSSAANSFAKLMQMCMPDGLTLCLASRDQHVLGRLRQTAQETGVPDDVLRIFPDLDSAAGWCDDQLLLGFADRHPPDQVMDAEVLLAELVDDPQAAKTLSGHFEVVAFAAGDTVFEQGQPGDALYLILGGVMSVILGPPDPSGLAIRTMRVGSIVGEMSVYTGEPRSASAIARDDSTLLRLSAENYRKLVVEHPAEAELFSAFLVRLMAERLKRANASLSAANPPPHSPLKGQ